MNCPSCNSRVPEGAFICSNCDHILDTSFLGSDITNEVTPLPSTRAGAPGARSAPSAVSASGIQAAASFHDPDALPTAGRVSQRLDQLAAPSEDTKEAIDEFIADFKSMAMSQKLTVTGAVAVIASLALPWKNTTAGDDMIGLLAGGWFVGLLAILVLVAMFTRRQPRVRKWRLHIMQGVAVSSLLACIACVAYMKSAYESRVVRSVGLLVRENTAWPDFGVYLALVASMLMLGGAIKSFIDRNILPD